VEQLGFQPSEFYWVIERRSRVWARHLDLPHVCYDESLAGVHWQLAGRFRTVINSEQYFGLSQATALFACGRGASLTSFETNRAQSCADQRVAYDPDRAHESAEFRRLIGEAMGSTHPASPSPVRERTTAPTGKPIVGLGGLQAESRAFTDDQWSQFIRDWA